MPSSALVLAVDVGMRKSRESIVRPPIGTRIVAFDEECEFDLVKIAQKFAHLPRTYRFEGIVFERDCARGN